MYAGFPETLLPGVACPADGGALRPGDSSPADGMLRAGVVRCTRCAAEYSVADGILRLMTGDGLDDESRFEQGVRDRSAETETLVPTTQLVAEDPDHGMEVLPTLEAVEASPDAWCLEIGCGRGRFTEALAHTCHAVIALDFSLASLYRVAERLKPGARVGLVHGDVTTVQPAPRPFDRILNTLHSNLPTPEHRVAVQRFAAGSLADGGRYVFSTHVYGLRERLAGQTQDGRYHEGGLYRHLFRRRELYDETVQWFANCHIRPIRVIPPFALRLGLPLLPLSRFLEGVPGVGAFAGLWLAVATDPRSS